MSNLDRYNLVPTTPPVNLCRYPQADAVMDRGVKFQMRLMRSRGELSSVAFCQERLGKQDYCLILDRRIHVWEIFLFHGFRILASTKGVTIEVGTDMDFQGILKAYDLAEKNLGIGSTLTFDLAPTDDPELTCFFCSKTGVDREFIYRQDDKFGARRTIMQGGSPGLPAWVMGEG